MNNKVRRQRGERASRRISMDGLKAAVQDRRYWFGVGIVVKPNGEAAHYEVDPDIGVLVHVKLMPDEEPLMCRLGGLGAGGSANGVWQIPTVGSEVAVAIPAGALENDTIIVAVLSSGGVPSELDATTVVVKGPAVKIVATSSQVTISDGNGGEDSLVKKSEFMAHLHTSGGSGSPTTTPTVTISGTSILKAK